MAAPPPKPVSKPGKVQAYKASFDYKAQQPDELSFSEGDILYVYDKTDPGWWKARCGERDGLVPSNYIAENAIEMDNPMHEAAKRGNLAFLIECLGAKVSPNGLDKAGSTPLHWAANGGHLDCVNKLLEQPGIAVNVQNKLGDTPLHGASWKGHPEVVQVLLAKGADPNIKNNEGQTPYKLSKNPDVGRLLQQQMQSFAAAAADYAGAEDDDSD